MENVTDEMVEARLTTALPPNWYAGPLSVERWFDPTPMHQPITYSIEFRWGSPIEGGPVINGGVMASGRRLTVSAKGHTLDHLVAVARLLPTLEPLGSLDWPIEFEVTGWTS